MTAPDPQTPACECRLDRRHALAGVVGVGLGAPLLAACGADATSSATDPSTSPTSSSATGSASGSASSSAPASAAFAKTTDIPVGSGMIYADEGVVVTQPTAGDFKGFSNICTHAGCPVGTISGDLIQCPCHGSEYSITDGSVQGGPAPAPLPPVAISVAKGGISLA